MEQHVTRVTASGAHLALVADGPRPANKDGKKDDRKDQDSTWRRAAAELQKVGKGAARAAAIARGHRPRPSPAAIARGHRPRPSPAAIARGHRRRRGHRPPRPARLQRPVWLERLAQGLASLHRSRGEADPQMMAVLAQARSLKYKTIILSSMDSDNVVLAYPFADALAESGEVVLVRCRLARAGARCRRARC